MYYIMRKSYYVMHKLLRFAKKLLRYATIITLCVVITLCGVTTVHDYAECIGTISSHNCTGRTHGRKQEVKPSEPNDDAGKKTTWSHSQNHISCICVEMVKCDIDARPSTIVTLLPRRL